MLEILFKTIEIITGLLKNKETNKEQILNIVIEPIYKDLQPLAEDYFVLFRQLKNKISTSPKNDLDNLINEITESREKFLFGRIKLKEMVDGLKNELNDNTVRVFCNSILSFFNSIEDTNVRGGKFCKSAATSLAIILREYQKGIETEDFVLEFIDAKIEHMELKWIEISNLYVKIRLKYINPYNIKYLKNTN